MDDLTFIDGLLAASARDVAYPGSPDLVARVQRSLDAPSRPASQPRARLAVAALAAAAIVALAAVLIAPASRSAVAGLFGIEGSDVKVLPTAPFPTPVDIDANARPASVSEIESALGRPVPLPAGATPASTYLVRYGDSPAAILRFEAFDLWVVDGAGDFEGILGKEVDSRAALSDAAVANVPARWISGGPHLVAFYDATGSFVEETQRAVERNTLIWRTDTALYRMETNLDLAAAIAIAETLP